MENIGIIICSRSDSRRVPNKPFIKLEGRCIIDHLVDRLLPLNLPVIVATPPLDEYLKYKKHFHIYENTKGLKFETIAGSADDPLKRTLEAADYYGFDHIIRITHDKIFLSHDQIRHFISEYFRKNLDYIYSTNFIDGMSFEIFSRETLRKASDKFENVEHLSYAIDAVATKKEDLKVFPLMRNGFTKHLRLLIDYPDDVLVLGLLFNKLGGNVECREIIEHYLADNHFYSPNKLPWVSIYTCAYNAEKYVKQCINSVIIQSGIEFEYIFIDDCSTDNTADSAKYFNSLNYIKNEKNIGLASSSNVALNNARGKYVMRLDADDYFLGTNSVKKILDFMESNNYDIVYPNNIQSFSPMVEEEGNVANHVGGAMFRRRALDYLKFTNGLRHFEGRDLYRRAIKSGLRIGYLNDPIFYYRQHENSMSRSEPEKRNQILNMIDQDKLGKALVI